MKLATSLILVALAIAGNIASGETFRGLKKDKKKKGKQDSVWCEGLDGPLKGLCNAYCDAMECHEDPNSNGCDRVLENYNKKKGGDDPAMPCLTPPTQCPCWTLEDLQNYPEPPSDSTCERDWNRCGDDGGQYNQDKIFYQSGLCDTGEFIAETVGCAIGKAAPFRPSCFLLVRDPSNGCNVIAEAHAQAITPEEFAVCEQYLNKHMDDLELDCNTRDSCNDGYTCPAP